MAINPYFKYGTNSEKNLYEDLITESIQNFGQNVYYIPREVVHRDMIFNDTILSEFNYAYTIEVYLESIEGFDGDGDLFSKFGVEIRDAVTFIMSRRRWDTEIRSYEEPKTGATVGGNKYYRPREGDLIHMPMAGATFEVMKVEDDNPFYQLANLPTFRIRCEKFEYSDERFNTEIPDIDRIQKYWAYQWRLTLDSASNGFDIGESVAMETDAYTMRGEVVEWLDSDLNVFLAHNGADYNGDFHNYIVGEQVIGAESGSIATITAITEMQEIWPGSPGAPDSDTAAVTSFDVSSFEFIDFSQDNPFGNIS